MQFFNCISNFVRRMRLELTRPCDHYPLKVARLPIPPLLHNIFVKTMCPEQDSNLHVSQHSHLKRARLPFRHLGINRLLPSSGKRGSNSRPQPWQGCALPTELFPRFFLTEAPCVSFNECKGSTNFQICKIFQVFFHHKAHFFICCNEKR